MNPTLAEKRDRRLSAEMSAMLSLNREGLLRVEGIGAKPYNAYSVVLTGPSYLKDTYASSPGPHKFAVKAGEGYPLSAPPAVTMLSEPVAHPNVYTHGGVCIGRWYPGETLSSITLRMCRVILMDPSTFNFDSPADRECIDFCKDLKRRGYRANVELPSPKPIGDAP